MVDPVTASRFGYRCLFLGLAAAILFVRLLPLSTMPATVPGPDLLLCLVLAWVHRRPDYVPAVLIVVVMLVDDIFSMRPPGLWTLIVLFGTEFLRTREAMLRDLPFVVEWLVTGVVVAVLTVVHSLVLALFMVPQAGLGPTFLQVLTTIAAYPIVVVATLLAFGVRKAAKGEVDARGHRV